MSNLKSIYIYQEPNIPESISASEFITLYNAVMDISTYWQTRRAELPAYCSLMGIDKVIDITGSISISKAALSLVLAVCYWANGEATNYYGKLRVNVNNYYLEFKDPVYQSVVEDIYNQFRVNGLIPGEAEDDAAGITTSDVKLFTKTSNNIPREGCVIQGVFYEERQENISYYDYWDGVPKPRADDDVKTDFDYFLFPESKTINNRLNEIKVFDLTPFCKYFDYSTAADPILFSFMPVRGILSRKFFDEMWVYVPGKWAQNGAATRLKSGTGWSALKPIDWCRHKYDAKMASGIGVGASEITKLFYKVAGNIALGNGAQFWSVWPVIYAQHMVFDYSGYINGLVFDYTHKANNSILLDSMREEYSSDSYLNNLLYDMINDNIPGKTKKEYLQDACDYITKNYLENGVITTANVNQTTGNYKNNFATYISRWGYHAELDRTGTIFVRDELYWWYVCEPLICKSVQTSASFIAFGNRGTSSETAEATMLAYLEENINTKFKCLTQYRLLYEYDENYFNRETNKFWWQQNNALNTIIQKEYQLWDDPYYLIYT